MPPRPHLPLLAFLLLAFALRVWQLDAVPPGMTHDEAGHGHDAAAILRGVTPIYFTVGYGREPLFDYVNAGWIAALGDRPFTLRLAAAVWGMLALAATYRFARLAFGRSAFPSIADTAVPDHDGRAGRRAGVLALACMAVSFWPLATSRQILRSGALPVEMALAALIFIQLARAVNAPSTAGGRRRWPLAAGLGLVLCASLYTYLPARGLWVIFPLAVVLATLASPQHERAQGWPLLRRVLAAVVLAFALASPLFIYLWTHPGAEARLDMLSAPLNALRAGDARPLLDNARETLLALFLPGHGDRFLAYNLPGRPVLDPILATLSGVGLILLVRQAVARNTPQSDRPTAWLCLCWLIVGLAPSLLTGPTALTTRAIGAQPIVYVLPALALARFAEGARSPRSAWRISLMVPLVVAVFTARDYFGAWARQPEVRAAFQSTLVAMLRAADGPTVISTLYPAAPHDPYIAERFTSIETRWVDARLALVIPAHGGFDLMVPASTPLHPAFADFVQPLHTIALLPNDLDPSFTVYRITHAPSLPDTALGTFAEAVELVDARWFRRGETAELFTLWRVLDPTRLGVRHPPADSIELNQFTHVLGEDGLPVLQRDSLESPAWDWQSGDLILQVHPIAIPADMPAGEYAVAVGLYDRITGERLARSDAAGDLVEGPALVVV